MLSYKNQPLCTNRGCTSYISPKNSFWGNWLKHVCKLQTCMQCIYIQCIYMYMHCTWVQHIVCIYHYCICHCILACTAFDTCIYVIIQESTIVYKLDSVKQGCTSYIPPKNGCWENWSTHVCKLHIHVYTVYIHVHTLYMDTMLHIPLLYMPLYSVCTHLYLAVPALNNAMVLQKFAIWYRHCS